jgi:small conductance mechanosensitive channel
VGISQLGDSGITISIEPWVPVADLGKIQGELNQMLVERFQTAHIEIPFPQREVRMLSAI